MRPAEISGDCANSEAALLHVLDQLHSEEGYFPDLIVFLQCTSPLTEAQDIDGTIDALIKEGANSACAVVPFHYFVWRRDADGAGIGVNHDLSKRLRRQDRSPEYLEAGSVYVMEAKGFHKHRHRFFGRIALHEVPVERRWEIDEPIDLGVASYLMDVASKKPASELLPRKPSAVITDFDGVLTDNRVWVAQDGTESVACSRADGMGFEMLRNAGIPVLIVSKEENAVVQARATKLKVPVLYGIDVKDVAITQWANENGIDLTNCIYIGNDLNDLPAFGVVGYPVAVSDAHPAVAAAARMSLAANGGNGAFRELCERILAGRTSEK